MIKVELGDFAGWLTGIGTLLAFGVGFFQIRRERTERQKRESYNRASEKRDQAKKISAWVRDESKANTTVVLSNQSSDPVYFMVVSIIPFSDKKRKNPKSSPIDRIPVQLLPPGTYVSKRDRAGLSDLATPPAVEIAFQDRVGQNWVRHSTGELEEIELHPMAYYQLPLGTNWLFPGNIKN